MVISAGDGPSGRDRLEKPGYGQKLGRRLEVRHTACLAMADVSRGVLVDSVAPGQGEPDMLNRDTIEYDDEGREQVPPRRFGQPEQISSVIELLAGPGGTFKVGRVVSPNGGTAI